MRLEMAATLLGGTARRGAESSRLCDVEARLQGEVMGGGSGVDFGSASSAAASLVLLNSPLAAAFHPRLTLQTQLPRAAAPFALRWTMGSNNTFDRGLSGGITYAFSPSAVAALSCSYFLSCSSSW